MPKKARKDSGLSPSAVQQGIFSFREVLDAKAETGVSYIVYARKAIDIFARQAAGSLPWTIPCMLEQT